MIGTVLFASVITAFASEGRTATAVKGIARLACVLAIVAPLTQCFLQGGFKKWEKEEDFFEKTGIEVDGAFIEYYSQVQVRGEEERLEKLLLTECGVAANVTLDWEWKTRPQSGRYEWKGVYVNAVCVKLQEEEREKEEQVYAYLTENYCSEVRIE